MCVDTTSRSLSPLQCAKRALRLALETHDGQTKHPAVAEAIENLAAHQKHEAPARASEALIGNWRMLSAPDFPGRIEEGCEDGEMKFTLGRMSFNMFQPKDLVCTIETIHNPVSYAADTGGEAGDEETKLNYNVEVEVTIHAEGGNLSARMYNRATCWAKTDTRLAVSFSSGSLAPSDDVMNDAEHTELWKKTFDCAFEKAEEERGILSRIGLWAMSWMFELTPPNDEGIAKSFEMKRPPAGFLDILFLDEELRVTRGNRGTVVVVERPN